MRSLRFPLLRLLALVWWVAPACQLDGAQLLNQGDPDGATITVSCPFSTMPKWCFLPLEIETKNPGQQAVEWRLSLSSTDYSDLRVKCATEYQAQRGGSRGSGLLVMYTGVRGYGGSGNLVVTRAGAMRGYKSIDNRGDSQSILVSAGTIKADVMKYSTSGHSNFDLTWAPIDWRAYCGFPRLLITDAEWTALSPAARMAIRHWLRLGGDLSIVRSGQDRSPVDLGISQADITAAGGAVSHGNVHEITAPVDTSQVNDAASYRIQRNRQDAENERLAGVDWFLRATDGVTSRDWRDSAPQLFEQFSGRRMSGLMVAVVVVFAVLAGPVNVFVLASARRRHRLFFTTPLISLGAGGLLVLAVVLSDGLGGKGQRFVWIENVPGENTSYVLQHQHSRCGAMFSTGFEIPEPAFFAPMDDRDSELAGSFEVAVGADKVTATGPWFSSRRSQAFLLSAVRPGRGRIELGGPPDRPVLTSALDFPVDRLFWLGPDGTTWWQAGAMAQGHAATLARCTPDEVKRAITEWTRDAPVEYGRKLANAIKRPGHFLAFAGQAAAIETHRSIRWQTHGIVTGPAVTP